MVSRETKRIGAAAEHETVAKAAGALDAPAPGAEPKAGAPSEEKS